MVIAEPSGLYPFTAFCIPDKFARKAENELFETDETRCVALEQLRELVLSDSELSCPTTDDFLLKFLRARKFNISRAVNLLKKYVNYKTKNAHIFTNMNDEALAKLVNDQVFGFLPYRCTDGCAVFIIHLNNWDPADVSVDDISRAIVLFLYHSICDPLTQINGYKIIFDVKSPGLRHLRYACSIYYMRLMYNGTQECFPGRFKGIHIINTSMAFKTAWSIIQPFLPEKLKGRIVFHKDNKSLLQYFPDKILPVDFGGSLKTYTTIPWLKNALLPENLERLAS